jgi:hypothetical protein
MAVELHGHRDMYKATFNKKGSPLWKEKFKEKCLGRVKEQKEIMLQKLRQSISCSQDVTQTIQMTANQMNLPAIVNLEWNTFQPTTTTQTAHSQMELTAQTHNGINNNNNNNDTRSEEEALSSEDYVDIIAYLEEQLREDLKREGMYTMFNR